MLNVFLTIDTEIWPRSVTLAGESVEDLFARDIYGRTPAGDYGIEYQMSVLERCGLRGVFFVDTQHAGVAGERGLRQAVERIVARGHDVQLHLHPEWLGYGHPAAPAGRLVQCFWQLPVDEQAALLGSGADRLRECGATNVCAFRAGSYAADATTLQALGQTRRVGLRFDSSFNPCACRGVGDFTAASGPVQPRKFGAVWEFPVGSFRDGTGRLRPAQIAAASAGELRSCVRRAAAAGWFALVIVTHSFELIRRDRASRTARPDPVAIGRFESLCRFLGQHADLYPARTFAELDGAQIPVLPPRGGLRTSFWDTAWRYAEQLRRKLT